MTELAGYTRVLVSVVDAQGNGLSSKAHGPLAGWTPLNCADDRILWVDGTGKISLWTIDAQGVPTSYKEHGPFAGWTPVNYADEHILWRTADRRISLWQVDAQGNALGYREYGPSPEWVPVHYADGHVLWRHRDGRASLWQVDVQGNHIGGKEHGPFAGWTVVKYADGHLLWCHTDGRASLWTVDAQGNATGYKEHGPIAGWVPVDYADGKLTWRSAAGGTSVWTLDEQGERLRYQEFGPHTNGGVLVEQRTVVSATGGLRPTAAGQSRPDAAKKPVGKIQVFVVEGPIAAAWQATGGESGPLGAAASGATLADDGETTSQRFVGGGITHHPVLGTAVIRSTGLYGDWHRQAALLGAPLVADTAAAAERLDCERGRLLRGSGGVFFAVLGMTLLCLLRHGAAGRPAGASEQVRVGLLRQVFDGGEIWEHDGMASFLPQAVVDAWAAAGGLDGFLHAPTSDLLELVGGTIVRFKDGAVVAPTGGVAVALPSLWVAQWETMLGGPAGAHGYPIAGVQASAKGSAWVDLQRGCLVRTVAGGWFAPLSLTVWVGRVAAYGDDGAAGNQDLYVNVDIAASSGAPVRVRLPESGTYGADAQVDRGVWTTPAVRGALTLDVAFAGWDSDEGNLGGGGDDDLGTVTRTLTIDDLWGRDAAGLYRNGDFSVEYAVKLEVVYDPKKFRESFSWSFRNFSTPTISRDQFARAYKNVETDESVAFHLEHSLFYAIVASCAKTGNCLGMCLESIYAQTGASLYLPPLTQYGPPPVGGACKKPASPQDDRIMDQINVRHTHQFGAAQLLDYLVASTLQEDMDGNEIFAIGKNLQETGQYPLIYVYSNTLLDDGHVVRPYAFSADGTKIHVANPNAPHPEYGDEHAWNVLQIDRATGHWQLDQRRSDGGGHLYTNNEALAKRGRIAVISSMRLLEPPEVPSLPEVLMLGGMFLALWIGSADVEQVSDADGRTLFVEGLTGPPTLWSDLRRGAGRIPGLVPVPPLGPSNRAAIDPRILADVSARQHRLLVGRGQGSRHTYRAVGRGGPVQFTQLRGRLTVAVAYDSGAGQRDEFTVDTYTADGARVLAAPGGARELEVTLGAGRRAWRLRGLTASDAAPVEMFVRGGGRELAVQSRGAPVSFDLDRLVGRQFVACASRADVAVTSAQELVIREESASTLSASLVDRGNRVVLRKWSL